MSQKLTLFAYLYLFPFSLSEDLLKLQEAGDSPYEERGLVTYDSDIVETEDADDNEEDEDDGGNELLKKKVCCCNLFASKFFTDFLF